MLLSNHEVPPATKYLHPVFVQRYRVVVLVRTKKKKQLRKQFSFLFQPVFVQRYRVLEERYTITVREGKGDQACENNCSGIMFPKVGSKTNNRV